MDIEKQLEAFYNLLDINPLSSKAIAAYSVLLQISLKFNRIDNLSVKNSLLMSKAGLSEKELRNVKNELISKKYVDYKKGCNQNSAPKYSLILLYEDIKIKKGRAEGSLEGSPMGGAEGRAEGSLEGNIQTKLNLFYLYINNNNAHAHALLEEKDKNAIINNLKRLEIYSVSESSLPPEVKERNKIQCWAIKELYFSGFKAYMNNLTYSVLQEKYEKTQAFMEKNDIDDLEIFIRYFIKSLQTFMKRW